jgi:hypothetical protein
VEAMRPSDLEVTNSIMIKVTLRLLVCVLGCLPFTVQASFQDWYGLLSSSWRDPRFPAEVSTTYSHKNLSCGEVSITVDGKEVPNSLIRQNSEEMWNRSNPLIKQTWLADKHLRVTVWLQSSADVIDSEMAFARENAIQIGRASCRERVYVQV